MKTESEEMCTFAQSNSDWQSYSYKSLEAVGIDMVDLQSRSSGGLQN